MASRMLGLCLFILATLPAAGADGPGLHLTGNPKVDFFTGDILGRERLAAAPLPAALMQAPGESGEKSPWLAGAMSLIVPGAGEVYTDNYLKGALFFAAEAASWVFVVSYNNKGDNQTDLFQNFANDHWSAVRYTNWTLKNIGMLNPNLSVAPPQTPEEYYGDLVYPDESYDPDAQPDPSAWPPPFGSIDWIELNTMERDVASGQNNGYTHVLPHYGEQQYYELIGKYTQFYSGWDDADITVRPAEFIVPETSRFFQYNRMRAKANDYYDVANTFLAVVVINHVVSAIDAFWSATRFNDALHAELRMRLRQTPSGLSPMTEARFSVRF